MGTDDDRHLTPAEQEVIAAELRRIGYQVTAPPWLREREDGDGFDIIGGGRDD